VSSSPRSRPKSAQPSPEPLRQAAHFEAEFPGASRSASEVLLNLARTSSVSLAELDRRHKSAIGNLSLSGWQALAVIEGAGEPLPPKVIGERLLLTSGSITSLLDTLERRGFVREPHPDDRRKLLVHITDEARKLVDLMLAQVHATSIDVMAGISEADRKHLIQTLAKLRANAEAMGARPVPAVTLRRQAARATSARTERAT
jgi:DNA-binding MarR family transcriptional regulator